MWLPDSWHGESVYFQQVSSDVLCVDSEMPPLPSTSWPCPIIHCPHPAKCCHLSWWEQYQKDTVLNLKLLKDLTKVSCVPVLSDITPRKNMGRSEFYIGCGQRASSFWKTWKVKISISTIFTEWELISLKLLLLNLVEELGFGKQQPYLQNHLPVLTCLILVSLGLDANRASQHCHQIINVQHAFTSRSCTTISATKCSHPLDMDSGVRICYIRIPF